MFMFKNFATLLICSSACLAITACGGGGGSSSNNSGVISSPPPSSNSPAIPNFVANSFPPSSQLKSVCETVRTDTDLDGNPRDDTQGQLIHELFWLRSFMDETYLFFDQVTDCLLYTSPSPRDS